MKKQLLSLLGAVTICLNTTAQQRIQPCNTFEAMEEAFAKDPKQKAQYEAKQAEFEIAYQNALNKTANKTAAVTYTIPMVFHIMGSQNVSDQTFINLINYLNNDYGKKGSDTASINATFAPLYKDAGIRFALAKRDPNGNCTNGIIHHPNESIYWSQTSPAYNYSGAGANRWPTNKYLNIYIVECIASTTYSCPSSGAFIGGYTYLPGTWATNASNDAIVLLKNQLAQSNPLDSRTISHEIGHWLNLAHTFGSSNNPQFDPSNMPTGPVTCSTDNVSDTPPTGGYFSYCPTSYTNDCTSLPNIENIMDYASCPKMFTQGQITRMQTALASSTSGRNNLISASNYTATGIISGYTCAPVANFTSDGASGCENTSVTFSNTSFVGENGASLVWNFPGGTPSTSTNSVETVSYGAAGLYDVSLQATTANGTNTKIWNSYVNITNGLNGTILPNVVDFETTGLPAGITVRNNDAGSPTWGQNTATGGNSTAKSIFLNNFTNSNTKGNRDFFETGYYDLSNTNTIGFSYYYAYAKKTATQIDSFKIAYSFDCGGTWTNLLGVPAMNTMATASGGVLATNFVPTAAQWKLTTISSGLLGSLANKPSVKFRFYFMSGKANTGSNNIYIDQINLTGVVTTGISELEKNIGLSIYPNPTSGSSIIDFNVTANDNVKISITDIMGRVVEQSNNVEANTGNVQYELNKKENLAKGVYIVNININNKIISKKLIIN